MHTAFFIVTNRCSKSCPFCFYSTRYLSYPADEMDEKGLLSSIERLAALRVRQIIITGGEPFLRREIIAFVRRAGELGMERLILTNGDLLNEQNIRGILECGVEGLSVSINSLAGARRFEHLAAWLKAPSAIRLTATIVFNRRNAGELRSIYGWAERNGMGTILQPAYIPPESEQYGPLSPHQMSKRRWEITARLLQEWGIREKATRYVDLVLSLYGLGSGLKPSHCAMASEAMVIDCDGTVYPCFHRRDLQAGNMSRSTDEVIMKNLKRASREVCGARCYGEHCVSLFYGAAI